MKVNRKYHVRKKGTGKGKVRKNPKKKTLGLSKKDWRTFDNLARKATRSNLDTMEIKVHKGMNELDMVVKGGFASIYKYMER